MEVAARNESKEQQEHFDDNFFVVGILLNFTKNSLSSRSANINRNNNNNNNNGYKK